LLDKKMDISNFVLDYYALSYVPAVFIGFSSISNFKIFSITILVNFEDHLTIIVKNSEER